MKKKTFYVLLFFTILFVSIVIIPNYKFRGTWIGDYSHHPKSDLYLSEPKLLNFKNISYFEAGPKYEITSIKKGYYLSVINKMKLEYSMYNIISIKDDSLVIKRNNTFNNQDRVYRRIPVSFRFNKHIDIAGKSFLLEHRGYKDTIQFKSDSSFVLIQNNKKYYEGFKCEYVDYNGFKVIFVEDLNPYIIVNKKDNIIQMKRIHDSIYDYTMTVLK